MNALLSRIKVLFLTQLFRKKEEKIWNVAKFDNIITNIASMKYYKIGN